MTKSSDNTKRPTPQKRIEMPSSFKDVTNEGGVDIFIGVQGMRKPEPKK
jgi:hypothetical protein